MSHPLLRTARYSNEPANPMSNTGINVTYPCPCCGHLVFAEPTGSYDICPICFWQDDESQLRFPTMGGGANRSPLIDAQKNFAEFGASAHRLLDHVRKPRPHEQREAGWRPINPMQDLTATPLGEALITCGDNYPTNRALLYYWRATESP